MKKEGPTDHTERHRKIIIKIQEDNAFFLCFLCVLWALKMIERLL